MALLVLPVCVALFLAVHHYHVYRLSRQVIEGAVASVCHEILADYERPLMEEFGLMALKDLPLEEGRVRELLQERIRDRIPGEPLEAVQGSWTLTERLSQEEVLSRQVCALGRQAQWSYLARTLADFFKNHKLPVIGDASAEAQEPEDLESWLGQMLETPERQELSLWSLLWPRAPVPWLEVRAQGFFGVQDEEEELAQWKNPLSQWQDEEIMTGLWAKMSAQWQRLLEKGQERIRWSSYLLQQCDYATSLPWKNRYFNKAEVEYILQGRDKAWNNVRETYLELYLLRTLIHAADQGRWTPPEGLSWVRLLGKALIQAKADVEKLLEGKSIQLIPGKGPDAGYRDHLLLLLLIQDPSEQHRRFSEVLAMNLSHWGPSPGFPMAVEGDTVYLGQYGTLLELEAEFSLTLWPWGERLLKVRGVQGYDQAEKIQWLH